MFRRRHPLLLADPLILGGAVGRKKLLGVASPIVAQQTFDADISGWTVFSGTPGAGNILDWQADDSGAGANARGLTGVLRYSWDSNFRIEKTFTGTIPGGDHTLTILPSFLSSSRVSIILRDGANAGVSITGSSNAPNHAVGTPLIYNFTMPAGSAGESLKIQFQQFSVSGTQVMYLDSVAIAKA